MRLTLVLLLTACASSTTSSVEPPPSVIAVDPVPGERDQGRHLLGEDADKIVAGAYHAAVARVPNVVPSTSGNVTSVRAQNGVLVAFDGTTRLYSGLDDRFVGIELAIVDAPGQALVITAVLPVNGSARYVLEHKGLDGNYAYCNAGGARAVAGRWKRDGARVVDSSLTLTCNDGVVDKCWDWGYGFADGPTTNDHRDPFIVHQTCTRLARADYCGEGVSGTMEETSVVLRDRMPGASPDVDDPGMRLKLPLEDPAPPDVFYFEAAWTPDGALCMAKERWKMYPLDGSCMPDPRTTPGALYCEQYGDLEKAGIMFNASMVGQMYLNRWTNRDGEQLATVRGAPGIGDLAEPPFPGYEFVEQIGLLMRNPPGSLTRPGERDPDLATIDLMSDGTDRVIAPPSTPPTIKHLSVGFEGYVYVDEDPEGTRLPLYLFQRGADFVSAVEAPSPSYSRGRLLGYIDAPVEP